MDLSPFRSGIRESRRCPSRPNFDPLIDSLARVPRPERALPIHKNTPRALRIKKNKELHWRARNERNWHWRHVECSLRGTHGQSRPYFDPNISGCVVCCVDLPLQINHFCAICVCVRLGHNRNRVNLKMQLICSRADPVVDLATRRAHSRPINQSLPKPPHTNERVERRAAGVRSTRHECVMRCKIGSVMIGGTMTAPACKSRLPVAKIDFYFCRGMHKLLINSSQHL